MTKGQRRIREILWQRIASGLHRGSLAPGQRLPSVRALGAEFHVAPRTVMTAYAGLARDGIVELRRRSGIYLADRLAPDTGALADLAQALVNFQLESLRQGVPPRDISDRLTRLLDPGSLECAAIAGNADQADHICRELRSDYGLAAFPVDSAELPERLAGRPPSLLVATALAAVPAQEAARELGRPLIVIRLRAEIIDEMIGRLRDGPVYFVGTDPRFADALEVIFRPTGWGHNLRPVILGRDDPDRIPPGAPVYILELAHQRMGDTSLTRRVRPIPRVFSEDTAREILTCIIEANLQRLAPTPVDRRPV